MQGLLFCQIKSKGIKMKPIFCSVTKNTETNSTTHVKFNAEDLRQYLASTEDEILWVETPDGTRTPFIVDSLREGVFKKQRV
jgi:hypothetical protein